MSIAAYLNTLSHADARAALTRCCGSRTWVEQMMLRRPYENDDSVFRAAQAIWNDATPADILEAFEHHPRIGSNLEALREKFAQKGDLDWSGEEQRGAAEASEATLVALRDENRRYEERFGYIFIVCATGKSADEMLALLRARMNNSDALELQISAGEQAKITALRLQKLAG